MIRYALRCENAHEFEAWFADSAAFDDQAARGLVECPACGSLDVKKQVMAPAVSSKSKKSAEGEAGLREKFERFAAKVRAHIADTHDYVGDKFADEARAMHTGEKEHAPIYGEATKDEAKSLADDGVPAAPLPPAFSPVPPKKLN
ncbi:MAG: DUF1178 family protein [Maricaulaceae bacterium]